ncbi:MAG: 4-hydroxy-tetrahydrodipicolinate synthase, partial [Paramuribaculum sp.]|nr:4-hydroxy-tetrahydrodipicolinate synthase [Paramuribaculum sp.]
MARFDLRGMGVALITPFKKDKSIDYDALAKLLDYQIKSGADYLVVLGTTAETPALSAREKADLKRFIADRVAGRVPLVIGCGGNNTAAVVEEVKNLDTNDFGAVLSVVPYYNKPSQEGIYQHYSAIAKASPLPIILYNVPGRTGVNMSAETTLRLAADHPNIIGIKEASGNISQMDEIIKHKHPEFLVISGDDGITFPLITLGAAGVISVIGNAFPREFSRMVRLALEGEYDAARTIHH